MEKEIVICAAVKTESGKVIRCHRHAYGMWVIRDMPNETMEQGPKAQGFVTSKNRYVDRQEGLALQLAAGIPSADKGREGGGYHCTDLFSEDLY